MAPAEIHITLCDVLNPREGYQIKIVDQRGDTVLFTSRDPVDGSDLLTGDDALRVAGYYTQKR